MRHPILVALCVAGAFGLSACDKEIDKEAVDRAFADVNVIDGTGLNEVMMTSGDPAAAVNYFSRAGEIEPGRIDLMRGLATSLVRAKRGREGAKAWAEVVAHQDSTDQDKVQLADALIRDNQWEQAEKVLTAIPPTHETYLRYRLEAMIADSHKQWGKADSFYEIAAGLTTQPAPVLNNWGYSKLSRGDASGAEKLFYETLRHDPKMFTAKNNLVLARGAQGNYTLPVLDMTQIERADLLYTLALSAIKRGDTTTGKGLLEDAIATHPQHFEAAATALSALQNGGAS